ncbi:hypothetical protein [Neobacillus soli]|nr:hypothetical protein [Neobacillus soli]
MVKNLPRIKNETHEWYQQNKFTLMKKNKFTFSGTNAYERQEQVSHTI